jgi:TNF receptor-associated protein 1
MTPQVDLYCKKVLIQKHPEELLPTWMRFVRGVVDSEDLPLNIARESMQDSQLLRRIASAVTGRFLKFLGEQAKENPEQYNKFYSTFGAFLKEGVTSDFQHQRDLAGLLRFESSKTTGEETTSLAEYVERMKPDQKDIYFLNGSSREAIEAGPYLEIFTARDIEVLYTKDASDDYVLQSLMMFSEKSFRSGDSPDVKLDPLEGKEEDSLSRSDAEDLCGWMRKQLEGRVGSVRVSNRLVNNPAMVVGDGMMTNAMRRMMTMLGREEAPDASSLTLEINPAHAFVVKLNALRKGDEELAKLLSDQLLDGVLLGAGLLSDAQGMVDRMNKVLLRAAK